MFSGATTQQFTEEDNRNKIAWSSAEQNIKPNRADVLVIFDCCGAGGFGGQEFRAIRRPPFQCIAACDFMERTPKPGPTSFTSALIWALEELRSDHHFTSIDLIDKIRCYPQLRQDQKVNLRKRDNNNDELVWIAPQKLEKNESVSTESERRNPSHEYMDLRLNFYRRLEIEDATRVAKCLSKLIQEKPEFQAKHIVLLDKTSSHSKAVRNFSLNVHEKRKRSTLGLSTRQHCTAIFKMCGLCLDVMLIVFSQ
ncbi:hypothetical protein J4E91_006653 [Alternaria rosae]|nr:hypothetical protein J4E91_006653 [Alternaria rosae]